MWAKYKNCCREWVGSYDITKKGMDMKKSEERRKRFVAYRFMWWSLGRDTKIIFNGKDLPACVKDGIRAVWPEASGKYSSR